MNRKVRVTFEKVFTVREDQDTDSIGRMYRDTFGMDVVKVEFVSECVTPAKP
jgi:hypothetical protein